MTKKLLNKSQQVYAVFILVSFLAVAPLSYFIIHHFYINEIDEQLLKNKFNFENQVLPGLKISDIPELNQFNINLEIRDAVTIKNDSLFFAEYWNTREEEFEPYREINSPVTVEGKIFLLAIRTNLVESEDLLANILISVLLLVMILLLGFYFVTRKISVRLWAPFYQTLALIEKTNIENRDEIAFGSSKINEFDKLNKSLTLLFERNRKLYHSQKEFIENAAHELQTPIAVFQAKIDALIQSPDLTVDQSKILETINQSIAKLNKLNRNILLLSRIDRQNNSPAEEVDINELIEKQLIFLKEQALKDKIKIEFIQSQPLRVKAVPGLTEILISNLLINAIQHNKQNGQVKIELREGSLVVRNSGSETALDKNELYKRFSPATSSRSGNGLGLAIVKKITETNGWMIEYSYAENFHVFVVNFKGSDLIQD